MRRNRCSSQVATEAQPQSVALSQKTNTAYASSDGRIYTEYHLRGDFSWRRSKFVYTITKPDAADVDLTIWYTTHERSMWVTLAPLQVLPGILDQCRLRWERAGACDFRNLSSRGPCDSGRR